ncbi:MetQ/NlpA family ABC transporter substrate-binding protein [Lactiplantibacillus paraplantarum]|uniref:Lipoprotein n=1 Tax=Lactiplantibacillus paraplantarum TaxID=60520 RepID=A0A2I9CP34_9LACO|nr:MetQ/NlpA family ABC transporter substrate-binding protein [Lactiplantibacillus paraplantarum]AVW10821.1 ABC transporter substrate-binding protein [Lactiplantibacillus paraplantarum]AYJ39173.1 ABC transporter substrate-binding protein [Lactiplantibacillus paraplantarum]ERL42938.1 amino acid ABC transporter, substrate binding protein [Lactiplantibacillus paraplantarum]KRL47984.1 amino acid ABC transporter substrate-binding protein [Lactiplantibacillus paraplantarum DSM 10667]MCU4684223.1 Met
MQKKRILGLLAVAATAILLVGCGKSSSSSTKTTTITVGASSVPHAQILKHVQPELKKEGVNLKIKVFQDYVLPNKALASKELDANYFQHIPFLDNWNKENNGSLVSAGKVHLEPIGVYSKKVKSLKDLKDGATVLVSSNVADYGRVLTLFKDAGLITLKKGTDLTSATFNDIKTNKRHLKFKHSYEAKLMPTFYKNNEGDAVVINANYAVQAGLNPKKDAIALEKSDSPYANIVAVRKGDKNKPAIKKLMKALRSKSTQQWIEKKYKGAILPVSTD